MIRGTTAQFKIPLPFLATELEWLTIQFWQVGNTSSGLPITKKLHQCKASENAKELYISLTPEETARFSDKYKARIQFRGRHLPTGTVFGIDPQFIPVFPMKDEIIEEDPSTPAPDADGWIIFDGGIISNAQAGDTT